MDFEKEVFSKNSRDPETFGRLYDEYYQPLFGFLYSRTRNVEIAKDLTSETFFQALKNFSRYSPRPGATFKSWLFRISIAQIGNYYRHRAKYLEVSTEEAPELFDRDDYRPDIAMQMGFDADELRQQIVLVEKFMHQLNQKQQTIISLKYFSHMTNPEISKIVKMKEGTVKSHVHRSLKKLNQLMIQESKKETSLSEEKQTSLSYVKQTATH